jgi:hypothetical protein
MLKPIISSLVLILFLFGSTIRTDRKIILPPGAKAGGNWSPGILLDGTLYVSGMGGEDASGKIPADFGAEVKQSLGQHRRGIERGRDVPSRCRGRHHGCKHLADECVLLQRLDHGPRWYAKLVGRRIEITATARK